MVHVHGNMKEMFSENLHLKRGAVHGPCAKDSEKKGVFQKERWTLTRGSTADCTVTCSIAPGNGPCSNTPFML